MSTQMKLHFNTKELVLMGMTLLLAPIFFAEIYGVAVMRRAPAFLGDRADEMPQFADLLIALALSAVFVGLRLVLTKLFQPLGRVVLSPTKRTSVERVERFSTVLFKFLYFVGITSFGYYVMKDMAWLPPALGGKGAIVNCFYTLDTPPSFMIKVYTLLQLGYHFHSLVYMLLLTPIRNDFLEMMVHHVATIFLIGCSYLSNYTAPGALVAFVHDIGDVTGYAIKAVVDMGITPLTVVMYIILLISWAYSRLFVFPDMIYHGVVILPDVNPSVSMVFLHPMNTMLSMLLLLHVYWYMLFIVMGYTLLKTGKQEDIQNRVNDKQADKKTA